MLNLTFWFPGTNFVGRGGEFGPTKSVSTQREFFSDNLLVRIHFIIETIWWTGQKD